MCLPRSNSILAIAISLFIVLFAIFSIYQQSPPDALPENALPVEFSAARAMKHVRAIAGKSRPIGSAQHKLTRDYLLAQLSNLGLSPEIQKATVVNHLRGETYSAATVRNVVARLRGGSGQAIMLVAHYDSVPTAPGASDDGAGVAALLETLRALRANPPLHNDVIFLFTDGEEVGLLGAKAFISENDWYKDVRLVLNFEARGSSGPAIMFETSAGNKWLISEFSKAARYPVANSFSDEIYRSMGNNTDLTVFKKAGLTGLNFAYIGGVEHYHTVLDTVESVDQRSLQHLGSYALTSTRHFGNLNLNETRASDAIYFNTAGPMLVHYPNSWSVGLAAIMVLLFVASVAIGFQRRKLTSRSLLLSSGAFILNVVGNIALVYLAYLPLSKFQSGPGRGSLGGNQDGLYILSFVVLIATTTGIIYYLLAKKITMGNLLIGILFNWLLLTVLSFVYLPGASYLLMWPFLFTLMGAAYLLLRKKDYFSIEHLVVGAIYPLPGIALLVPLTYLVYQAFGIKALPAITLVVTLLLSLLIPLIVLLAGLGGRKLLYCLGLLILAFIASAFVSAQRAGKTHTIDHIFYAINADSGKAVWASLDLQADEWTSQFFQGGASLGSLKEFLPLTFDDILIGDAPLIQSSAPRIDVIKDEKVNDRRDMQLYVLSSRKAPIVSIDMESNENITGVSINGKNITDGVEQNEWKGLRLLCYGFDEDGITLTIRSTPSSHLKIRVVDESYGLPQIPDRIIHPRPEYIIPAPAVYSDSTLVSKTFTF
jgi:hypothetical protein